MINWSQLRRLVVLPSQFKDESIDLSDEQQHYLRRVLRLQAGDRFIVMDGQGHTWLAELQQSTSTQAKLLEPLQTNTELPIHLTLIAALPKGSGFDEVVRQVTELGVTCIQPVISDRTLINPSVQKVDRWRRIASEAAEQSERLIVPTIEEPIAFDKLLNLQECSPPNLRRYLCVTRRSVPHLLQCLASKESDVTDIYLTIGPEGGWTEAEVEQAIATGYQPVSLGSRILRAVTAPIVALSLITAHYEKNI
jgi:16S rRNA (uracil1498-N3)-methyltransferase